MLKINDDEFGKIETELDEHIEDTTKSYFQLSRQIFTYQQKSRKVSINHCIYPLV